MSVVPSVRSVLAVALCIAVAACVPSPPDASPSGSGGAIASDLPVASGPPSPGGASPSPSFVRPTPTPLPSFRIHIVAAGETLSSIARTYSTSLLSLAVWNRDEYPSLDPLSADYDPNRIQVGWRLLVIPGVVVSEEDVLPTAVPTRSAAPATAGPSVGAAARVVRHGPRDVATVALTFDMGGRLDPAQDILAWLIEHEVAATIFPTGRSGTATAEGRSAVALLADHPELFDIGNHSWSHPDFRDLDAAAMRDQLERTEAAIVAATARSTRPWFRPPYGGLDDQIPAVVGAAGWPTIVMWDVDTIDWRPVSDGGPTAGAMAAKVVADATGGSIVLMHLGGHHTLEALPAMLDGLAAKGLRPVTLDEMFGG